MQRYNQVVVTAKLLKEEKTLTSAVSGALDRLQGETDPCCKYDTSKKTWQFLHQGRSAEDFSKFCINDFSVIIC